MIRPLTFLRALEPGDLDRVHAWHNDAELYEYLLGTVRPVSRTAEAAWLEAVGRPSSDAVSFAVCAVGDDRHLGNAYLRDIDWVARTAEVHLFLGEATDRDQGLGQDAIRRLCEHAFDRLQLDRLWLRVLGSNRRARSAYAACGFVEEGLLRRHARKRASSVDVVVMGLLRDEWDGSEAS